MYFAGISLLKRRSTRNALLNLNIAERWTQSIFNHILDDESFVYGLTNIKNYGDYTLNHP